jgi:ribonucleoside-diphosphate reductase alpha chain
MLGISGGIEPIFANYYTRTTKSLHNEDVEYKVYTPIVQKYMQLHNIHDDKDLPEFFVTAQTLDYHKRIAMQAAWQRYIDASISSTVNVPNEFTVEDVENLYMEAWENGLKGITLFRDGCERAAILNVNPTKDKAEDVEKSTELKWGDIIVADDNVIGLKRKLMTGCGSLHCTAFFDPITGELMETYLSKGSTGGCLNSLTGLSRMISLAARAGVPIHDIVDQLESTGVCPSYAVRSATKGDTSKGSCCPVAVGRALMDMYNEMQASLSCDDDNHEDVQVVIKQNVQAQVNSNKATCPTCGEVLVHEGGCDVCKSCGWSRCG